MKGGCATPNYQKNLAVKMEDGAPMSGRGGFVDDETGCTALYNYIVCRRNRI